MFLVRGEADRRVKRVFVGQGMGYRRHCMIQPAAQVPEGAGQPLQPCPVSADSENHRRWQADERETVADTVFGDARVSVDVRDEEEIVIAQAVEGKAQSQGHRRRQRAFLP